MLSTTDFFAGLGEVFSFLGKLAIILAITLFFIVFIKIILKRINASWAYKYTKKIDSIITSAKGLKSIVKSFEELIDVIFNAVADVINLFALFVTLTFTSISKIIIYPLKISVSYINLLSAKLEKHLDKLNKQKDDLHENKKVEEREDKKNQNQDVILDEMLKNKDKK